MKKFIFLYTLITIIIMLNGCSATKNTLTINHATNITKIEIKAYPGSLKTTENNNEITEIINYFNSLDLKKTTKTTVTGMSYTITVYFNDKTSKKYEQVGNSYFIDTETNWYKIPYEQAQKFEDIYNNLGEK